MENSANPVSEVKKAIAAPADSARSNASPNRSNSNRDNEDDFCPSNRDDEFQLSPPAKYSDDPDSGIVLDDDDHQPTHADSAADLAAVAVCAVCILLRLLRALCVVL